MKIIVGLGNPGKQYEKNRHNIGFMALDALLGNVKWQDSQKFKGLIYDSGEIIYLKPQTFMNNSGEAVRAIMSFYGLLPKSFGLIKKADADLNEVLTVIQDDIDIELGKWKISSDSRSGGHRGIQSIITHLKTQKFRRIKIGVKNEQLRTIIPAEKFVIQNFLPEERLLLEQTIKQAIKSI
jgi:PTH1 family peptidyl-tRNA hydrolase